MRNKILAIAALAAMLLPAAAHAQFEAKAGNRAPELFGTDAVTGDWVDMADFNGKWVLAEFWATW
ncbi:hypothetical protein KDL29_16015 [bacterium]|nr:hypothetical protein [bacterium]MCB1222153.1 hypothetical protein [bacterium]UNM08250.1 MAG: hypothetical protein H7A35_15580 [Planctomycetales bacterium]